MRWFTITEVRGRKKRWEQEKRKNNSQNEAQVNAPLYNWVEEREKDEGGVNEVMKIQLQRTIQPIAHGDKGVVSSYVIQLCERPAHVGYWNLLKGPGRWGDVHMDEEYMFGCRDAFGEQPEQTNSRSRSGRSTKCSFHFALGTLQNFSIEAE